MNRLIIIKIVGLLLLLCASAVAADLPGDATIAFGSNREDGRHEVYLIKPDGTGLQRLTLDGGTYPTWSPDGAWISYWHPVKDHGRLIKPDGTGDKKICDGFPMSWMPDGSGVFCDEWGKGTVTDPATSKVKTLYLESEFSQLDGVDFEPRGVTHDGHYLLGWSDRFREGYEADNGAFQAYHAAIVLDLLDKSKLYFFGEGCEPTAPPSGDLIYHVRGDGPTLPDIYRMSTKDLATRSSYEAEVSYPDADWGHEYTPRTTYDNQWLTYIATTGCHNQDTCDYEIFVHRLGAGSSNRTRVTNNEANDQWPHMFVEKSSPPPPPIDAGPKPTDGGPTPPPPPTDGPTAQPDAGPGPGDSSPKTDNGSGGCAVTAERSMSPLLLLLVLLLRRRD